MQNRLRLRMRSSVETHAVQAIPGSGTPTATVISLCAARPSASHATTPTVYVPVAPNAYDAVALVPISGRPSSKSQRTLVSGDFAAPGVKAILKSTGTLGA